MSVARVVEITATSDQSFEDALQQGVARATQTLRNVRSAWVKEQEVQIENGEISGYKVNMLVTFVLDDNAELDEGGGGGCRCARGRGRKAGRRRGSRVGPHRRSARGPRPLRVPGTRDPSGSNHASIFVTPMTDPRTYSSRMWSPGSSRWLTVSGPDTSRVRRTVGILDVGEVHVPRDLPVNADWLDLAKDRVASAFQHGGIITGWRLGLEAGAAQPTVGSTTGRARRPLARQPVAYSPSNGSPSESVVCGYRRRSSDLLQIVHADAQQSHRPPPGVRLLEQREGARGDRVRVLRRADADRLRVSVVKSLYRIFSVTVRPNDALAREPRGDVARHLVDCVLYFIEFLQVTGKRILAAHRLARAVRLDRPIVDAVREVLQPLRGAADDPAQVLHRPHAHVHQLLDARAPAACAR